MQCGCPFFDIQFNFVTPKTNSVCFLQIQKPEKTSPTPSFVDINTFSNQKFANKRPSSFIINCTKFKRINLSKKIAEESFDDHNLGENWMKNEEFILEKLKENIHKLPKNESGVSHKNVERTNIKSTWNSQSGCSKKHLGKTQNEEKNSVEITNEIHERHQQNTEHKENTLKIDKNIKENKQKIENKKLSLKTNQNSNIQETEKVKNAKKVVKRKRSVSPTRSVEMKKMKNTKTNFLENLLLKTKVTDNATSQVNIKPQYKGSNKSLNEQEFVSELNLQTSTLTKISTFNSHSILTPQKVQTVYECKICCNIFNSLRTLHMHEVKHLTCRICQIKFPTLEMSVKHSSTDCIAVFLQNKPKVVLSKIDSDKDMVTKYYDAFQYQQETSQPKRLEHILDDNRAHNDTHLDEGDCSNPVYPALKIKNTNIDLAPIQVAPDSEAISCTQILEGDRNYDTHSLDTLNENDANQPSVIETKCTNNNLESAACTQPISSKTMNENYHIIDPQISETRAPSLEIPDSNYKNEIQEKSIKSGNDAESISKLEQIKTITTPCIEISDDESDSNVSIGIQNITRYSPKLTDHALKPLIFVEGKEITGNVQDDEPLKMVIKKNQVIKLTNVVKIVEMAPNSFVLKKYALELKSFKIPIILKSNPTVEVKFGNSKPKEIISKQFSWDSTKVVDICKKTNLDIIKPTKVIPPSLQPVIKYPISATRVSSVDAIVGRNAGIPSAISSLTNQNPAVSCDSKIPQTIPLFISFQNNSLVNSSSAISSTINQNAVLPNVSTANSSNSKISNTTIPFSVIKFQNSINSISNNFVNDQSALVLATPTTSNILTPTIPLLYNMQPQNATTTTSIHERTISASTLYTTPFIITTTANNTYPTTTACNVPVVCQQMDPINSFSSN